MLFEVVRVFVYVCFVSIVLIYRVMLLCFLVYVVITSAKEVMFLPEFVCLSVKKLWKDFSEIFRECREWQKLQVVQFWG